MTMSTFNPALRFMEHLADDASRRDLETAREYRMMACIMDGAEFYLLGRRARVSIEWLDEDARLHYPPEFLAEYAAKLRETVAGIESRHPEWVRGE